MLYYSIGGTVLYMTNKAHLVVIWVFFHGFLKKQQK